MEPPPLTRFVSRKSKRLCSMSGASSSRYDPDVIEIKQPASKSLKYNQVVPDDVIEIDGDDDLGVVLIDEKTKIVGKGKAAENGHDNSCQLVKDLVNLEEDGDDAMDLPPGVEASIPWLLDSSQSQKAAAGRSSSAVHSQSSSCCKVELVEIDDDDDDEDEVQMKFKAFKQFDTVEDYSDHFYVKGDSSRAKPSKAWAKKIQEEWKIMDTGLPDTIFVRVYEGRMDLLRAVIVGAAGTPYHDGLFFFDVLFPLNYPNGPPQVHYHSGGLRLNPNLYNCGKVCLSLLNTWWSGDTNQRWIRGKSTMLQVLVSIQALVLNAKPYFNEPGYEMSRGQPAGEKLSREYNEATFILSCRTMLYSLNRPLKNFEDFVVGHFYKHAYDILEACKAYMEGAQVGCLVKGGVQDVDEGDKSCSKNFKKNVYAISNLLFTKFTEIGAKGCMHFAPKKIKE